MGRSVEILKPEIQGMSIVKFELPVELDLKTSSVVPSSWWQYFKRDCFPKWYLKRWPAKMVVKSDVARQKFHFKGQKAVLVQVLAVYPRKYSKPMIRMNLTDNELPEGSCLVSVTEIKE